MYYVELLHRDATPETLITFETDCIEEVDKGGITVSTNDTGPFFFSHGSFIRIKMPEEIAVMYEGPVGGVTAVVFTEQNGEGLYAFEGRVDWIEGYRYFHAG